MQFKYIKSSLFTKYAKITYVYTSLRRWSQIFHNIIWNKAVIPGTYMALECHLRRTQRNY